MMKSTAPIMFVLLISGCADKNPADSYKAFIENEIRDLNSVPNVVVDEQFKSEVEKSDLSATPVVGTCVLDLHRERRIEGVAVNDAMQLEMKHELQGGKWVMTAGSGKYVGVESGKKASAEEKRIGAARAQQIVGTTFNFKSLDELKKNQLH
jgi:hypothetical protein